ncbi:MAG: hypothetical protein JWQ71_1784 [Pedosphaera sp.]|nr:hypothetical protein [Pedosphaera sp.]
MGAGDPDGAVGFEDFLAAPEPFGVEFVVPFGAAGFVPIAFVDADHFAGVTGDAAVGKEIGRVGEDHVEPAFGVFGGDGVEDGEAVVVVEPDAVGGIFVGEVEEFGSGSRVGRVGTWPSEGCGAIAFEHDAVEGIDLLGGWIGVACYFFLLRHNADRSIRRGERSRKLRISNFECRMRRGNVAGRESYKVLKFSSWLRRGCPWARAECLRTATIRQSDFWIGWF